MKIIRTSEDKSCKIHLDFDQEKDVSRLWIHDFNMRIGTSTVKMGGIGGVGTKKEHRMKGYARKVLTDSNAYMMESGFDVAMLFGISNFYTKFGYATALPEYRLSLKVENATEAKLKYSVRKLEESDFGRILEIYQSNNRLRSGTIVRTNEKWDGFEKSSGFGTEAESYVITDKNDRILGYFVWDADEEKTTVSEVGYETEEVFETMIKVFVNRAEEMEVESVSIVIPPEHPLAVYCRRYGCHVSINYPKNGGGMMRIMNLHTMLMKIEKELVRRLSLSHLNNIDCKITISTQEFDTEVIEIQKYKVKIAKDKNAGYMVEIPQYKLIQLVMGYRGIYNLVIDSDVKVSSEELLPVIDVLFPTGYPYLWWPDRF